MFRTFGHTNSSVIDGGLPRWADEGFTVETSAPAKPKPSSYSPPQLNDEAIRSKLIHYISNSLEPIQAFT